VQHPERLVMVGRHRHGGRHVLGRRRLNLDVKKLGRAAEIFRQGRLSRIVFAG
jgi:hypothetical protein